MPKRIMQEDLITWRDLMAKWKTTDKVLWDVLAKKKAALYRKVKNSFQPAPDSMTLAAVRDLYISLADAARIEWDYWQELIARSRCRSEAPDGMLSSHSNPRSRIPIRLPDNSKDLLRVPFDPNKIQLTRSPVQTADAPVASQPKKLRKLQPKQIHREMFQKEAKRLWDNGSRKSTAEMVQHLLSHFKTKIDHEYNPDVVRRWIYKLNPKYSPGNSGRKTQRKQ